MPQHFQDMIKGNVNSSSCSFYKLVAWETWVKLACVAWRSKFARSRPRISDLVPRAFLLKNGWGILAVFPPLARLYYLATKTAMLRRLGSSLFVFY